MVQMGSWLSATRCSAWDSRLSRRPRPDTYGFQSSSAVLLASALAFYVQGYAQRVLTPSRTSMVLHHGAVFSLIFGMILLSERLSWRGWIGCALIFAGMLITEIPGGFLRRGQGGDRPGGV